ncbi:hypothetical protein TARUN_7156 [Trichoderma arundinaceum]|uniref:Uncharacterized protein n=1 Tax=Trichoderma arundinaceum TaxID=490622 RepID=A0A395NGF5_TRIAR|nr:hypothetical protein TARUN_7156 [Trichoderma arundinaceum]
MHQSWFEYGLTRQYPFRWFTPVAVIGGIILPVVFSFINLGANAFDTIAVYTNDPNGTESDEINQWYMKVPFNWGSTFKPDCEPRQLSVGDQFFTTNQGFYYTLKSIKKGEHVLPSLRCLNTTLQKCITRSVEIRLRKSNIQPDATMAISWGSSELSAAVECTVIHDNDFFFFDFFLLPSSGIIATGENRKLRSIDNEANVLAMYANRTGEFSAAAKEGLQLAKVMHSLISIDLGNNDTPNYLLRSDALQNLLAGTDDYNRQPGGVICDHPTTDSSMILPPHGDIFINLNESYQAITPLVGKLGTQNATIYTQLDAKQRGPESHVL